MEYGWDFFETNDDRVITEILSGVITVGPDAHTVFQNYFFSSMIAGLYVLIPNIPWYGLALIVIQALAYVFVLDTIYCRCASKSEMVFASATVVFVFFSNIYMLGRIQFTSTAMIAAIAGYVCLILSDTSKRQWIFFFILELFALFLRKDSMLVIVPIGLAVLIGKWLIDSQLTFKQRRNYLVRIFGILGCVLLIGYLGDIVGYSSPEWREYRKLNQARAELFDYFEEPAYEEIKPILDSHGITKASYEAYCNYTMLDTSMTSECVEEIVAYCMNQKKNQRDLLKGCELFIRFGCRTIIGK